MSAADRHEELEALEAESDALQAEHEAVTRDADAEGGSMQEELGAISRDLKAISRRPVVERAAAKAAWDEDVRAVERRLEGRQAVSAPPC